MIVSKDKQFVFIHNPKVAGSAFKVILKDLDSYEGFFQGHEYVSSIDRVLDKAHLEAKHISLFLDEKEFEEMFVFGFVRNPYDRFVSSINEYLKLSGLNKEHFDLDNFIKDKLNITNIKCNYELVRFIPQYLLFFKGNKCIADYIGRYECFNESCKELSKLLNVELDLREKVNSSSNDGYKIEDLSSFAIDFISDFYSKDFCLFSYEILSPGVINSSQDETWFSNVRKEQFKNFNYCKDKVLELKNENSNLTRENDNLTSQVLSLTEQLSTAKNNLSELENVQDRYVKQKELAFGISNRARAYLRDVHILQSEIVGMKNDIESKKSEIENLKNKNHQLEINRNALNGQIDALFSSTSWKLTKPMRYLVRTFRGIK